MTARVWQGIGGRGNKKVLSIPDNTFAEQPENEPTLQPSQPEVEPKHNTRAEIAKAAKVSTGQVARAEVIRKRNPKLWEKAKQGEVTINQRRQCDSLYTAAVAGYGGGG